MSAAVDFAPLPFAERWSIRDSPTPYTSNVWARMASCEPPGQGGMYFHQRGRSAWTVALPPLVVWTQHGFRLLIGHEAHGTIAEAKFEGLTKEDLAARVREVAAALAEHPEIGDRLTEAAMLADEEQEALNAMRRAEQDDEFLDDDLREALRDVMSLYRHRDVLPDLWKRIREGLDADARTALAEGSRIRAKRCRGAHIVPLQKYLDLRATAAAMATVTY